MFKSVTIDTHENIGFLRH